MVPCKINNSIKQDSYLNKKNSFNTAHEKNDLHMHGWKTTMGHNVHVYCCLGKF